MENTGIKPVWSVLFAVMLASFYVVPHLMLLAGALLVLHAARGVKESIEALTLSYLIGYLNPGMFDFPSGFLILRWMILFTALPSSR